VNKITFKSFFHELKELNSIIYENLGNISADLQENLKKVSRTCFEALKKERLSLQKTAAPSIIKKYSKHLKKVQSFLTGHPHLKEHLKDWQALEEEVKNFATPKGICKILDPKWYSLQPSSFLQVIEELAQTNAPLAAKFVISIHALDLSFINGVDALLYACKENGFYKIDLSLALPLLKLICYFVETGQTQKLDFIKINSPQICAQIEHTSRLSTMILEIPSLKASILHLLQNSSLETPEIRSTLEKGGFLTLYLHYFEPWNSTQWASHTAGLFSQFGDRVDWIAWIKRIFPQTSLDSLEELLVALPETMRRDLFQLLDQAQQKQHLSETVQILSLAASPEDLKAWHKIAQDLDRSQVQALRSLCDENPFNPFHLFKLYKKNKSLTLRLLSILAKKDLEVSSKIFLFHLIETKSDLNTFPLLNHLTRDPSSSLIAKLVHLGALYGYSIFEWMTTPNNELLDYLLDDPFARAAITRNISCSPSQSIHFNDLKKCWDFQRDGLKKLIALFGSNIHLLRASISTLSKNKKSIPAMLAPFFELDLHAIQANQRALAKLGLLLLTQNHENSFGFLQLNAFDSQINFLIKSLLNLLKEGNFALFNGLVDALDPSFFNLVLLLLHKHQYDPSPITSAALALYQSKNFWLAHCLVIGKCDSQENCMRICGQIAEAPTNLALKVDLFRLLLESAYEGRKSIDLCAWALINRPYDENIDPLDNLSEEQLEVLCALFLMELRHLPFIKETAQLVGRSSPAYARKFMAVSTKCSKPLLQDYFRLVDARPAWASQLLDLMAHYGEKMEGLLQFDPLDPLIEALFLYEDPFPGLILWQKNRTELECVLTHPLLVDKFKIVKELSWKYTSQQKILSTEDVQLASLLEANQLHIENKEMLKLYQSTKEILELCKLYPGLAAEYYENVSKDTVQAKLFIKNMQRLSKRYLPEMKFIELLLNLQLKGRDGLVDQFLTLFPEASQQALGLADLAAGGYELEAITLIHHLIKQKELLLGPKLLAAANSIHGEWIKLALKIDVEKLPELANAIIHHECPQNDLLLSNLLHLAVNGEERCADALLQMSQRPQKEVSECTLLHWVSAGCLTHVRYIWQRDLVEREAEYFKIRAVESPNVQRALLSLYDSSKHLEANERSQLLAFALRLSESEIAQLNYLWTSFPHLVISLSAHPHFSIARKELEQFFSKENPIQKIDSAIPHENKIPRKMKSDQALAEQLAFSVAVAETLTTANGEINASLIPMIKETLFFQRQKERQTTLYHYLDWIFEILEKDRELSARFVHQLTVPKDPARLLIRTTLQLDQDVPLTLRHVQVVVLSALLQRPWQSSKVGSCFATSHAIRTHYSKFMLFQVFDDYASMIHHQSLIRFSDGQRVIYPLALDPHKMKDPVRNEHPLSKGREYLMACMASEGTGHYLRSKSAQVVFSPYGLIATLVLPEAIRNEAFYQAAKTVVKTLEKLFLDSTREFYDANLYSRKTGSYGGWVLGEAEKHLLINTRVLYEQLILRLIEQADGQFNQTSEKHCLALLRDEVISGRFAQLASSYFKSDQEETPWSLALGGNDKNFHRIYYGSEQSNREIRSSGSHPEMDMRAFFSFVHACPSKMEHLCNQTSQYRYPISCPEHSFNFIPGNILAIQETHPNGMIRKMKAQAKDYGCRMLNETEKDALSKAILAKLPNPIKKYVGQDLVRRPVLAKALREFCWLFLEKILNAEGHAKNRLKRMAAIESAVLKMNFLKPDRPDFLIAADLNWHHHSHDSIYLAYAGCFWNHEINIYSVREQGRGLAPLYHRFTPGISFKILGH
jgi:hypothetical protein